MEGVTERIEQLIKNSGKSANAILTDCKLSHNSLIAWKSRKAKPSLDAIIKLADYFNISIDFLVGRENKPIPTAEELVLSKMSKDEIKLINTYRAMPLFNKLTMKMFIHSNPFMWIKKGSKDDLITKEEMELLQKMQNEIEK